jgi:quercetin dioxygenase-like cupin family protein
MRHYRAAEITSTQEGDHFRRMVLEAPGVRTAMLGFEAGEVIPRHAHMQSHEVFLFVRGTCTMRIDDEAFDAGPGDLVLVEPGGFHEFTVHAEPLVVLAVVAPNLDDVEMG